MAAFYRLFKNKWVPPAITEKTFAGKTVLITGGNKGLGLEAAKKIAALDAWTVIITARDQEKGELAKEEIEFVCRERAMDDLDIQVWPLDMSDFSSVKQFAERVNKDLPRLDAAILNAGQSNFEWRTVSKANGPWEMTLMVNTIATAYLGLLLLPKLLSTARMAGADAADPPHLTFVSSGAAVLQKVEKYEKLQSNDRILESASTMENYASEFQQYSMSKVFLEYSMRHLAELPSVAKDSGEKSVIVNSICPGLCNSGMGDASLQKRSVFIRILVWLFFLIFARTSEEGSRSYVTAVQTGVDSHGKMWKNDEYRE